MSRIIDPSEVLIHLGIADSPTDEERAVAYASIIRAERAIQRFVHYDPVKKSRTEYYPQQDLNFGRVSSVYEVSDEIAYLREVAGEAGQELQVQHIPIRTDTAIQLWIDYDARSGTRSGAFGSDTLKTEGTDYWANYTQHDSDGNKVCVDGILHSHGAWPTTAGSVKITYTAGYTSSELHGEDELLDGSAFWDVALSEAVRRFKLGMGVWKKKKFGHVAGLINSEGLGDYRYSIDPSISRMLFGSQNELSAESQSILTNYVNMGWLLAG